MLYIQWNCLFLIILQENIDTVAAERFENVGEEDCIKIVFFVAVFCGNDLFTAVCVCSRLLVCCTVHYM